MSFSISKISFVCLLSACFLLESSFGYLPTSIKACSRNLPNIEECIINTVDKLRPRLANGDFGKNFEVPKIEPLIIDTIQMKRGQEFSATFSQLLVNGPSNFVVEKLKVDVKNLFFDFVVLLPKLNFTGKYSFDRIRLLLLDINGKGDMRGSFKNARGYVKARGHEVEKNGVKSVQFDRLQVRIHIDDSKIHLDNLFNGDPVLGQVGNLFINENSKLFLAEIIPGLEKSLSKTFTDIANSILATTSYDEMFPEE